MYMIVECSMNMVVDNGMQHEYGSGLWTVA